jgi:hypothetical protein
MRPMSHDESTSRPSLNSGPPVQGGRPPLSRGARPRRLTIPVKVAIGAAVVGGFAFLFLHSIRSSRSEPYRIDPAHLRGWSITVEHATHPKDPLLMLKPPAAFTRGLFSQIFSRYMESLVSPLEAGIPLLLEGEFEGTFAGHTTPEALAEGARSAGLDATTVPPRCMAYRRTSEPRMTRVVSFVIFGGDAFAKWRRGLRATLPPGVRAPTVGDGFDAEALSPILFVGASDPDFGRWLPLRANPQSDCVAPIEVAPGGA